jgi:hypothetical protein
VFLKGILMAYFLERMFVLFETLLAGLSDLLFGWMW